MVKSTDHRFILVTRKTRLQELVERFNTWPQAKFYLEHNGVAAQDYLDEHDLYQKRLYEAEVILKTAGRFQLLERTFLPNYRFDRTDIIVVIGQDGLVANTLKYLDGQPVIAINPDPSRFDGKLLPFEIGQLEQVVMQTVAQRVDLKSIVFAKATTNDGQKLLAVNDLFIGPKSHTSARYKLTWNQKSELQSSSGIIVSTGFGSTGWFQSVLAGAMGVAGVKRHKLQDGFAWDAKRLQFAVREPFPSRATGTKLIFGSITSKAEFMLESHMPENGVIFSDGIEEDFIQFNSGSSMRIKIAEQQGCLVSA